MSNYSFDISKPVPLRYQIQAKWLLFVYRWMGRATRQKPSRFHRATWRFYEWLRGARPVHDCTIKHTLGGVHEPGIDMSGGGACPVQWDGTVDGLPAYYRARGQAWSLEIGDDWCYDSGIRYHWPDAGYLPACESAKNIIMAVAKYRSRKQ